MLLRRDAASPGGLFAEAQEFAQRVTERGKMANGFLKRISVRRLLPGRARHHEDNYIAIRCILPSWSWRLRATRFDRARQRGGSRYEERDCSTPGQARAANSGGEPPHSTRRRAESSGKLHNLPRRWQPDAERRVGERSFGFAHDEPALRRARASVEVAYT